MTEEENLLLHKETVKGIIKMVHALNSGEMNLLKLIKIGLETATTDDAQTFICEFAKDELMNLSRKTFNDIVGGNYVDVWKTTNKYLGYFGYEEIEPCEIQL